MNAQWSMQETEKLARFLYGQKETYGGLVKHLKSPELWHLLGALAIHEPLTAKPARAPKQDLLVIKLEENQLPRRVPRSWRLLRLGRQKVAIVRPLRSWFDWNDMMVCTMPVKEGGKHKRCRAAKLEKMEERASGHFLFASRYYPRLRDVPAYSGPLPYKRTYSIALSIKDKSPGRVINLPPDDGGCRYLIEKIEGLSYKGTIPSSQVVIRSSGAAGGRLSISIIYGIKGCPKIKDRIFPPFILETALAEKALRRYLGMVME